MEAHAALIWLLVLPLVASPAIYLAGRIGQRVSPKGVRLSRWLTLVVLLAEIIPLYITGYVVLHDGLLTATFGEITFQMDGISLLMSVTVLLLTALVVIFSMHYMDGEENEEKYYALLSALVGAMLGLSCARDLFNLWIWFEAMAVTTYLLVAFYRDQRFSLEAGVKYLVQSAVGSLLVLLGIGLVFIQAGTLDLEQIRPAMAGSGLLGLAAGGLFVIGFGVKTALVPMHTWLPDAHSQAPSGISAMLSGVVIESGLIALLRALGCLSMSSHAWGGLLLAFGALNVLVGNLMALRQTQVKRMLAYSSIAQVGYILIGLGVAVAYGISDGAAGGFFHIFNHAMMKGLAFLSVGALLYALLLANGNHRSLLVEDLNGVSKRYPLTAFTLSLALLALGGLPPLSGFMSKWQIFLSGGEARNTLVLWLIVFAGLNSVLSLGYYAPLVNRMYRKEPSEVVLAGKPVSAVMALPLLLLSLAVVVLGFWPSLMSWLTAPAASSLLTIFGYR